MPATEGAEPRTSWPTSNKPARVVYTPDGRYIVVRGQLWRAANPQLTPEQRQAWVHALMDARRAVRAAQQADDDASMEVARAQVQAAKEALGERGPVWWGDGSPDYQRHMVHNTPYAEWYANLQPESDAPAEGAAPT